MDAKTLEALKASIAKWEENAAVTELSEARVYGDTCPLCKLFSYDINTLDCKGCPVAVKTGKSQCNGSPWDAARGAKYKTLGKFRAAARKEVAFLKSLLPAEEAQ